MANQNAPFTTPGQLAQLPHVVEAGHEYTKITHRTHNSDPVRDPFPATSQREGRCAAPGDSAVSYQN